MLIRWCRAICRQRFRRLRLMLRNHQETHRNSFTARFVRIHRLLNTRSYQVVYNQVAYNQVAKYVLDSLILVSPKTHFQSHPPDLSLGKNIGNKWKKSLKSNKSKYNRQRVPLNTLTNTQLSKSLVIEKKHKNSNRKRTLGHQISKVDKHLK